jgi:hypothetical protein
MEIVIAVFAMNKQASVCVRKTSIRIADQVKFQSQTSSGRINRSRFEQIRTFYWAQGTNNNDPKSSCRMRPDRSRRSFRRDRLRMRSENNRRSREMPTNSPLDTR